MKIYVMTDSHLGHTRILEHGVRKEGYEQHIFDGILELPHKHNDLIIHLGDVCIGDDEKHHADLIMYLSTRFSRKVLVRGNHDNKSDSWYYKQGWDFVCRSFHGKYFGKNLFFSHEPHSLNEEYFAHNIHGHLHGGGINSHRAVDFLNPKFHIDVAPELRGYAPVNLEKLI